MLNNKYLSLKLMLLEQAMDNITSIEEPNVIEYKKTLDSIKEDLDNQMEAWYILCSGDVERLEKKLWEMDTAPRERFWCLMNKVLKNEN